MYKDNLLIVHFPAMVSNLIPEPAGSLARFLNPGLYNKTNEKCFHPENLVLDTAEAKSFLSQSIQFGEQFRKPSDMAYFGVQKVNDFYSDTSLSLGWQISTYGQEESASEVDSERLKAQQLLILEYVFEEKMAELESMNRSLGHAWDAFDSSLGIEREDEDFAVVDRGPVFTMDTSANWKKLLWAFELFLPSNACLLLHGHNIGRELEDAGAVWEKTSPDHFWDKYPPGIEVHKAALLPDGTKPYLSRIKNSVNFLMLENM